MKTAKELGLTEEQHSNFNKLLEFVKANPNTPFNIDFFTIEPAGDTKHSALVYDTIKSTYNEGTTRCLVGLGPLAGLEPLEGEIWGEYLVRVFDTGVSEEIYDFLFNCEHENSLDAATRRLEQFLTNGIPEDEHLPTFEVDHE